MPGIGDREREAGEAPTPEERRRLGRDPFLAPGARVAALVLLVAIVVVALVSAIRFVFGSNG